MKQKEFEQKMFELGIQKAKAEAQAAELARDKAKVELETAEMIQRYTSECIQNNRNPLAN